MHTDTFEPVFSHCPTSFNVNPTDSEIQFVNGNAVVSVQWAEPIASDNVGFEFDSNSPAEYVVHTWMAVISNVVIITSIVVGV